MRTLTPGGWPEIEALRLPVQHDNRPTARAHAAYEDGPTVVFAKGKVAKRYLKDRFFIDLVTTVPWDFIALQWTGNRNNRFVQMIRLTRCFRFLRLHDLMHIAFSK